MNHLKSTLLAAALALGLLPSAGAAILYTSPVSSSLALGDSFTYVVSVEPEAGERISAFQFDLDFSPSLTPGPAVELGYFALHGVFFFPGLEGSGFLAFISDALAGADSLPQGRSPLFQIEFTATQPGPTSVSIANPLLLDPDGASLLISAIVAEPPAAPVPEPSTFALAALPLAALLFHRRRRS